MNILLSGSLAYDYVMSIPERLSDHILPDHLDKLNLSLVANKLRRTRGGTAGNIAYTMSLLNTPPFVVGALGSDGTEYLDFLRGRNLETKYIAQDKNILSSSVYIVTDKDGNQISTFFPGVDPMIAPSIKDVKEKVAIAIASPSGNTRRHIKECEESGIKFIFDPGQITTSFTQAEFKDILSKAYMVIGNAYETSVILERSGLSMPEIMKDVEIFITTKGADGSDVWIKGKGMTHVPVCKPNVVQDPTGAGDAYRGGFLAGLARGFDIVTCAEMGSVAGTYCVENDGGQGQAYTISEFCDRYEETYHKSLKI